ncbi:uncharacterized protein LOC126667011 [Mercurialis annua]|uniref:uncharacterized protein LOC126667011 n=1 Tax=Mercurialis annua TaxID=3986 RepID=UPI00215F229D|nr:uncharacterized protein LOC126667011 [Mercurialis annua]
MANKSPVFPMPEPQHFSDYGFDPQINYFQFLEEARNHKQETVPKSIDSLHFKLQKPISKDDHFTKRKTLKNKKKKWWKKAFLFLKFKWIHIQHDEYDFEDVHKARARAFRSSVSGPVYITESCTSGSNTPYRATTRRPTSGPIAGTLTPARSDDLGIPYLSLRELNMEQQEYQRFSTSTTPIYLVT